MSSGPAQADVPSRLGRGGALLRGALDRTPALRRAVKSTAGQQAVAAARAATSLQPADAVRLAVATARRFERPGRYRLRSGTVVVLRPGTDDVVSLNEVFHRDMYAFPAEVAEVVGTLGPAPRVADIGANVGMFSAWALEHLPGSHVVAVEPDPQNAALLRAMCEANALGDRVEVREACAAVTGGVVHFRTGAFMRSGVTDDARAEGTIDVPAIDVMGLLGDVDVIKIDIEGSEWPILADPRLATSRARAIALEWHATAEHPAGRAEGETEVLLAGAGFRVVHRYSEEPSCGTMWAVRDPGTA